MPAGPLDIDKTLGQLAVVIIIEIVRLQELAVGNVLGLNERGHVVRQLLPIIKVGLAPVFLDADVVRIFVIHVGDVERIERAAPLAFEQMQATVQPASEAALAEPPHVRVQQHLLAQLEVVSNPCICAQVGLCARLPLDRWAARIQPVRVIGQVEHGDGARKHKDVARNDPVVGNHRRRFGRKTIVRLREIAGSNRRSADGIQPVRLALDLVGRNVPGLRAAARRVENALALFEVVNTPLAG